MPEKSALKLTNIIPDFIIHGHKLHGLYFHGYTLVHEMNASLNCAIFGKIAQIKWIRLKCRKVLVRTT